MEALIPWPRTVDVANVPSDERGGGLFHVDDDELRNDDDVVRMERKEIIGGGV